jgi:hypothetical protein
VLDEKRELPHDYSAVRSETSRVRGNLVQTLPLCRNGDFVPGLTHVGNHRCRRQL